MQVLGQYVALGDVIRFPIHRRKGQSVLAPVMRIQGMKAFDADGNSRELPYDDHITIVSM